MRKKSRMHPAAVWDWHYAAELGVNKLHASIKKGDKC